MFWLICLSVFNFVYVCTIYTKTNPLYVKTYSDFWRAIIFMWKTSKAQNLPLRYIAFASFFMQTPFLILSSFFKSPPVFRRRGKEPDALHPCRHRGLTADLFLRLLRCVRRSHAHDAVLRAEQAEPPARGLQLRGLVPRQIHRGCGLPLRSVHQVRGHTVILAFCCKMYSPSIVSPKYIIKKAILHWTKI